MFYHQSLFFCIKSFGSSNRLTESSENILFQFFHHCLLSPEIFFTDLLYVLILGSICLTNSVTDFQFCCLPNILLVMSSYQSIPFPQTSSCTLVDGEILCHVQHLPFCPKLLTQHKDAFEYCMYCASGRKCIQL